MVVPQNAVDLSLLGIFSVRFGVAGYRTSRDRNSKHAVEELMSGCRCLALFLNLCYIMRLPNHRQSLVFEQKRDGLSRSFVAKHIPGRWTIRRCRFSFTQRLYVTLCTLVGSNSKRNRTQSTTGLQILRLHTNYTCVIKCSV